ncbi:hypothetical protein IQ07DRAFT_646000 [Pyrenochaeta sp. DS3sAY3a]|nr:hypothetical protein IQ07DRAFT_646000 [Pyrenochaeta sp. DS3sAY3a]
MPVLEICRKRLHNGILPTDPSLKATFSKIRNSTGAQIAFYSAIEEPPIFFVLALWPSLEAFSAFAASPSAAQILAPINAITTEEWLEFIELDALASLPLSAPIMTISRCFFKEHADHPARYHAQVSALVPCIEAETKPWRYIGAWTVDTTPGLHKWMVFGGWRSKRHHQEFATRLKGEVEFFEAIPEHYAEGTVHRHCWDMERQTDEGVFEVLEGFVPQRIGEAETP